jgi:predicted nucleotidyltransferase component of viral defense system
MDEIKRITPDGLRDIAASQGFPEPIVVRDYYVTLILYLLKEVNGIYFKGGTALQKIFLDYSRLSEDADYTVTRDVTKVISEIEPVLKKSGFFSKITRDKDVKGFTRIVCHYKDPFGEDGTTFIDLNERAKLIIKEEAHDIPHFYAGHIPAFSVKTLALREMVAEKMSATIGRNKPRDHFDLYKIIQNGGDIDLDLVKKKCELSGNEFDITKMFHQAKKLKNRWDDDMAALLKEQVTFQEVMKALSKYFKYSEEKERLRKNPLSEP